MASLVIPQATHQITREYVSGGDAGLPGRSPNRSRQKGRDQPLEPPSCSWADPSGVVVPLSCSHLPPVPHSPEPGFQMPPVFLHVVSSEHAALAALLELGRSQTHGSGFALPQEPLHPAVSSPPAVSTPPARTICRTRSCQLSAIRLQMLASSGPPPFGRRLGEEREITATLVSRSAGPSA